MVQNSLPLLWRRFPERYNLHGNRCENCGTSFFPRRGVCPNCRRKGKLVAEEMPRTGNIVSWTEVHVGPAGFENEAPYILAIVELSNKARLLTQIVDSENGSVKIGSRVAKCFRRIATAGEEGPIAYGYKFKVVGAK